MNESYATWSATPDAEEKAREMHENAGLVVKRHKLRALLAALDAAERERDALRDELNDVAEEMASITGRIVRNHHHGRR